MVSSRRSASREATSAVSGPSSVERDPAAHERTALVLVGEPQQEPAGDLLVRAIEMHVSVLGEPRDRALDAAAAGVRREPELPPVAAAPQLEQRRRQQRQRARPAFDVAQQRLDELGLDDQPDPLRRALDRSAQLVTRHRADEHIVGAEQVGQLGVGAAAPVEIGADGEHDDGAASGGAHQRRR